MNQVEIMDFLLQMQADFDLPDKKIHDPYFQTGWQNALLPYGKTECLEALQEYAESQQGVNRPRIANILEIIRKRRSADEVRAATANGAWNEIETVCAKGILWAGEAKKRQLLSEIDPKCLQALEKIAGCKDGCSEAEKNRGVFRTLMRIASTDIPHLKNIKEEFASAYNRQEGYGAGIRRTLLTAAQPAAMLPEKDEAEENLEHSGERIPETEGGGSSAHAGAPKYILEIIEKRKQQYKSGYREA